MDRIEAFEILELAESASLEVIRKRWQEKFNHFQNIYTNAPTPQLKAIHSKNLEKLEVIKKLLLEAEPSPRSVRDTPQLAREEQQKVNIENQKVNSDLNNSKQSSAIAFLVRHTEGKEAKTYSLVEGKNAIGRQAVNGINSVLIDDDPYVSRCHALLAIYKKEGALYFEINDNGEYSQGKPSKNGTYINAADTRIERPVLLREQDTIQIGVTKLMLKVNNKPLETIVKDVRKTQIIKTVLITDLL